MNTIWNALTVRSSRLRRIIRPFYFSFFVCLFLFQHPLQVLSQSDVDEASKILLEFVNTDIELSKAGSYFNVVRVKNNSEENFKGALRISLPEGWNFIGSPLVTIDLSPNEEYLFPVRLSVPPSVLGGISYVVNAELRAKDYYDYASTYISITPISKWEMKMGTNTIYLSDFRPQGEFSVDLSNKGNSYEMIKLKFETGGLLEYLNPLESDSLLFVELPAYTDTTLVFKIRKRADLSYAEKRAMINNWRESSIYIESSTSDYKDSDGLRVFSLESRVLNDISTRNSPLNIDLSMNNILSYQVPKVAARVSGKILFPESQQLQYNLGIYNIYFDQERNRNIDLNQQLRFMLRYDDKNTSVELGDRLGMGELHTLSGQGIRAQHTVNDDHTIFFNVANNPYSKNLGVHGGYSTLIKNVMVYSGLTLESNTNTGEGHYSVQLGSTFNIRKKHRIRFLTTTSLDKFSSGPYLASDTSKIGFAYRLSYNYYGKRFQFRADNTNTQLSYLRNSGINRINMRANYRINDVSRIEGVYYRNSYNSSSFPYGFTLPGNKNTTDNGQLIYSVSQGNKVYFAGPFMTYVERDYFNPNSTYSTKYSNIQPGIMGSVSFRLGMMRNIAPYIRVNSMFVNYSSDEPDFAPYTINGQMQYTAGLSYYDKAFKFNAYFSSGDASDIYRTVVVEQDPQTNQSFNLRPYYERYFKKDAIRLSGYMNYTYYLPSTRENLITNLTSDFIMDRGWKLFLSFNLYRIVRQDEVAGRITSRDINILAGLRKSFDIQQPRMKYYDLTIIGFDDQNGNGIKDATEKPVSNVLIKISRDNSKNIIMQSGFSEIALITDPNGEIFYEAIPEGTYDLDITALSNLENLYFLNGDNQVLEVNGDMIHYLPLVETYKVRGKVIVDRDPNSSEGKISLEGIRVSAVSENGETFSVLTDSYGAYTLSLPKAAVYEVSIYNVFGEQFTLEQGRYKVQFSANKTINLDFVFTERRRQLQFREGEQFFDFNIQQ